VIVNGQGRAGQQEPAQAPDGSLGTLAI